MPQFARNLEPGPTPHPRIVHTEGVCGGRARIAGSRVPVSTIAELYRQGESVGEIALSYPSVDPAAIHDAVGYYLDHRQEVDAEIESNSLDAVLADTGAVLGEDGVIRFVQKPR